MPPIADTPAHEFDQILERAASTADRWAALPRDVRARALEQVAEDLDAHADELVRLAQEETHLAEPRLRGELKRTTFQLRLFADVVAQGEYLDARIDYADADWPMGAPRPDLRRMLEPLGPVVVFAASNFPFAFSVAGGDTAAALAAGCPVILKAHPGHPLLSKQTGEIVAAALEAAGAPVGVFAVIFGTDAGRVALTDPRVKAGSFTGSIAVGRALFDLAVSRPEPIPFYGELGSTNPVFVTEAASDARADEIAAEFVASMTLSAGQFCTKPGVLLVPEGSSIPDAIRAQVALSAAPLLNERIQKGYTGVLGDLLDHPKVRVLVRGDLALADPPTPTVLTAEIEDVIESQHELLQECFGPAAIIVTYRDADQLLRLASQLEGQLTATIIGEGDETFVPDLMTLLARRAGRLLWNQWPTGVSVTYAQQHGGPYPATTASGTTSVGTAAITRFLRPVAYQGFPEHLLPDEISEAAEGTLVRRVDGRLRA